MKRMTKITTLLLALITLLMMSQAVFADNLTAYGGTYTFNGSNIVQSGGNLSQAVSGMMPGDTVTIEFRYKNEANDSTEWYLRNEVLKTLEETAKDAKNGGYTYNLTNYGATGTTPIFDSVAVAGDENYEPGGIAKGLKGATDATGEFFHIDTLSKGQSGRTVLTIGLDGESQGKGYENALAQIAVQYAVEILPEGEDTIVHTGVKTGDDTNLLVPLAVLLAGALLLILALISRRKERKDGETL